MIDDKNKLHYIAMKTLPLVNLDINKIIKKLMRNLCYSKIKSGKI